MDYSKKELKQIKNLGYVRIPEKITKFTGFLSAFLLLLLLCLVLSTASDNYKIHPVHYADYLLTITALAFLLTSAVCFLWYYYACKKRANKIFKTGSFMFINKKGTYDCSDSSKSLNDLIKKTGAEFIAPLED